MVPTLLRTADAVEVVARALTALSAPAAGPLVIAIDGRSGSGKTELAGACTPRLSAAVVHMDDLYPGWDGLAPAVALLGELLARLRTGAQVRQPVWDWSAGAYTREVTLPTGGVLIVEGVGSGCAGDVDLLVRVRAGADVRRRRALARDGETFRPHWERWAAQEDAVFAGRFAGQSAGRDVRSRVDLEFGTEVEGEDGPLWELHRAR